MGEGKDEGRENAVGVGGDEGDDREGNKVRRMKGDDGK